jgi:ribonuclease HI
MKHIYLTVDGACSGNPGPGGSCLLRYGGHMRELFGSEEHTTNNRMELRAVIEGLKALHEPCEVTVITDSQYVTSGITQWLPQWKANGWRKKSKGASYTQAVLNRDLWEELENALVRHAAKWERIKGHSGHEDNIRCDQLASRAARIQPTPKAV